DALTPALHDGIASRTRALVEGLLGIAARAGVPFSADSAGSMFGFFFRAEPVRSFTDAKTADVELFKRFFHAALRRGVYLAPTVTPAPTRVRSPRDASSRTVRIALADGKPEVRLTSTGTWQIFGPDGQSAIALTEPSEQWRLYREAAAIRAMREDSRPVSGR